MTTCPTKLFQFIRGALRGAYGTEDLQARTFLIIGVSRLGQDILGRLCLPGVDIRIQEHTLVFYTQVFGVCSHVDLHDNTPRDVIIDTMEENLTVKGKKFGFSSIGDDPYTQGIHEAYL